MSTNRVEAFSDGVFAVAITLLVLDLRAPLTSGSLIGALADEWPEFAAFLISFMFIGVVWVNHHAIFHRLARVDRPLLFFNLFLLLAIVVIPFVTSLFALYVAHADSQASVAAALFNCALLMMAVGFQLCTVWIDYHPALLKGRGAPRSIAEQLRFATGVFAYVACLPLSFIVNPILVLAIDGAVGAFYIADQVSLRNSAG